MAISGHLAASHFFSWRASKSAHRTSWHHHAAVMLQSNGKSEERGTVAEQGADLARVDHEGKVLLPQQSQQTAQHAPGAPASHECILAFLEDVVLLEPLAEGCDGGRALLMQALHAAQTWCMQARQVR